MDSLFNDIKKKKNLLFPFTGSRSDIFLLYNYKSNMFNIFSGVFSERTDPVWIVNYVLFLLKRWCVTENGHTAESRDSQFNDTLFCLSWELNVFISISG